MFLLCKNNCNYKCYNDDDNNNNLYLNKSINIKNININNIDNNVDKKKII